ncbi:IclR family transcriptional regulator domain-containing protein [Actinophytocola sp.]|uniref:IclR family transcriptional regulator domain-containing protein n=1 Tax=Actinophytocola sp. TaxID=1872138 RepID=UPI003D6C2487
MTGDSERQESYVQSLSRGLGVLRCFTASTPNLTIAEVAHATGLTRSTARRFLHTLKTLGYVGSQNGRFHLRPRVLELGYAYLSSVSIADIAQECLAPVAEELHEACSAAVLDGHDIFFIARVQTSRVMSITLTVGTRLPAYLTSLGRVLLAGLSEAELDEYLRTAEFHRETGRTVVEKDALRELLAKVRRDGYCLVDQEMEIGVRSVAVPVRDGTGNVVAAVNAAAHASRVGLASLRKTFLPRLQEAAQEIETALAAKR